MKKLVVLKAGSKLENLKSVHGDFEDWILEKLPPLSDTASIIDIAAQEAFPSYEEVAGIVITGSSAMVTDQAPWILRSADWLHAAVGEGIPILGICFGHQLLAYALGGRVDYNPLGVEVGTMNLNLLEAAQNDSLFTGLTMPVQVQTSHRQCVLELPAGAIRLAFTELDQNHAFRYGEQAWGVQFHPEFSCPVVSAYIDFYSVRLHDDKKDFNLLRDTARETDTGRKIFTNFLHKITTRLQLEK